MWLRGNLVGNRLRSLYLACDSLEDKVDGILTRRVAALDVDICLTILHLAAQTVRFRIAYQCYPYRDGIDRISHKFSVSQGKAQLFDIDQPS